MSGGATDLYRSDTILVRRFARADTTRWAVTFDYYGGPTGFDREGFAERFFAGAGVSAIHVLGRGSDWYHYPDIEAACRAVRAAIPADARVMTYGSSMGGFAALRLAEPLGASVALALSPQYSIDPAAVPWERRWARDSLRIASEPALSGPVRSHGDAWVVYDPGEPDRRHAELIARDIPAVLVRLRNAGHPVTSFLGQSGLLRPLVLGVLDGSLDAPAFARRVRTARGSSERYLDALSLRQLPQRPRLALAIADRLAARHPDGALAAVARARALAGSGRFDEALALFARAGDAVRPRDRVYLAEALARSGRAAEAIELARGIVARSPEAAHLRHWLAWMLDQLGDPASAIAEQERAVALAPGNAPYAARLATYRKRQELVRPAPAKVAGPVRALRWLGRRLGG